MDIINSDTETGFMKIIFNRVLSDEEDPLEVQIRKRVGLLDTREGSVG